MIYTVEFQALTLGLVPKMVLQLGGKWNVNGLHLHIVGHDEMDVQQWNKNSFATPYEKQRDSIGNQF